MLFAEVPEVMGRVGCQCLLALLQNGQRTGNGSTGAKMRMRIPHSSLERVEPRMIKHHVRANRLSQGECSCEYSGIHLCSARRNEDRFHQGSAPTVRTSSIG